MLHVSLSLSGVSDAGNLCNGSLEMVSGLAVLLLCSALSVDVASQVFSSYLELRESLDVSNGASFETCPIAVHHKHTQLCLMQDPCALALNPL